MNTNPVVFRVNQKEATRVDSKSLDDIKKFVDGSGFNHRGYVALSITLDNLSLFKSGS